ncbi:hypothetical protein [Sphingosinicella sp.]|uniref:hypothetical protein n=1 Tax=Sphingosinicella sp. TaxID=1917971 RepID=UPI002638099E|nr:hypothetical protein [Sphingosinicella sp.]
MNKSLIIALAAVSLAAGPALAADSTTNTNDTTTGTQMQTEGSMNPTAGAGAQPSQEPGAPTSNRSNEPTPVPNAQVDKAPTGETSDRTPQNHTK